MVNTKKSAICLRVKWTRKKKDPPDEIDVSEPVLLIVLPEF
jgi:hypothetical protein